MTPADGDPTRPPTPRRSGPIASGNRRRLWAGALLVAALLLVGLGVVTFSTNPVIAEIGSWSGSIPVRRPCAGS